MCRLFAFVAPDRSSARRELGHAGMESLLSLARLHGDGWGWAAVEDPGMAPVSIKSEHTAVADPRFEAAVATKARAAMVHLRWATAGLPVRECNAHPFHIDGIAFEHNGTLKPIEALRTLLSPASLTALSGDTDSEMYFALIREHIARGLSLLDATVHAVRRLREAFPFASLNAILLGRDQLVVVHASASSFLTEHDLSRLLPLSRELPSEHNEDYFALRWRESADGTIAIGSTGVTGAGWTPMPAESVTAIRLDDRTRTTVELSSAAAHG